MSDKVNVKTQDYADWLKTQAESCMNLMITVERGFDDKFSEMGIVEKFINRKGMKYLQEAYSSFDRLLTSFSREYMMAQFLLDQGHMVMELLPDNHFHTNRNVAIEIYELRFGKIDTEKD